MYLTSLIEPERTHPPHKRHLVFLLVDAHQHGLKRIPPEPYTCECGVTLTPEVLDKGDESKASWPNCKSWREGGRKKCPECGQYPSIDREQHIKARGYEPTAKERIKQVTAAQRESALKQANGSCLLCDRDAEYVTRMVPPRYGGTRDVVNLAALCEHHYEDFGFKFVDILQPREWHKTDGIEPDRILRDLRNQLSGVEDGRKQLVEIIDNQLDKGIPRDPFPYLNT